MKQEGSLLTRREWLAAGGMAAAVSAAAAGQGARPPRPPTAPVSIAKCSSYAENLVNRLQSMFDQIGGIGTLVGGKTVTIKLNMTGSGQFPGLTPGQTHWVHPTLVGACCAALAKAGARRIRLVEGTGNSGLEDKMLNGGWNVDAIRSAAPAVEFENTDMPGDGRRFSRLKVNTRPYIYPAFDLNHSYEDTDVFVSLSKLKTHADCGITLSLKNSFGNTPTSHYGPRQRVFHLGEIQPPKDAPQEIDFTSERYEGHRMPRLIVDITGARPIDLAIIDGIESAVGGEGPWIPGCKPCRPGVLILGRNPVCTDAVAVAAMGYNPRGGKDESPFRVYNERKAAPPPGVGHQYCDNILLLAEAVGIGSPDLSGIDVRGVPIKDALYDFEARWKGQVKI
jgi:uncharacterized protein (DUF362 family)